MPKRNRRYLQISVGFSSSAAEPPCAAFRHTCQQICGSTSPSFILEVEIAERLTIGVADDEADIVRLVDGPWRWKTASSRVTPGYPRAYDIKDRTNSESVRKGFEVAVRAARTAKRAGFLDRVGFKSNAPNAVSHCSEL